VTKTTEPVSGSPTYNFWLSRGGRISADGQYVTFSSQWVSRDHGNKAWVHDRVKGTTTQIGPSGNSIGQGCYADAISADGRYVAFESSYADLVSGDTNYDLDVFLYNRETGEITGVSTASGDVDFVGPWSWAPAISADGRYVAFTSDADNLVAEDTNGSPDVFVRDRLLSTSTTGDLQATVTAKPASVRKGQTASYRLTVKNNGPNSAGNVALTDIVSNGTVLSIPPSQGTCSKAAISVCRLNTLAAGASATVTVTIRAEACSLTQQISVNAAPKDNKPYNNAVRISTPVIIP
jgi:uncharacterized repeat protein (TIGR01451 family)